MFAKSIMIPKHRCIIVNIEDSVEAALNLLESRGIDCIPVLDGDKYAGVITHYHIYKNYYESNITKEEFLRVKKVKDIATHQDKFLNGDEIFEETLVDLKDFPLLAVVDEQNTFLGIVTRFDVLEQFQSAFGIHKPGVRIAFSSVEVEGRIARLADIIQQYHESVISLVTFDETDKLVRRIVLKIEKKSNIDKFIAKLESSGFRILHIVED
ncbi:CBS domain-containing protein [Bacillus sp. FJAT-49736]|uniref:CBS domain-containing protein n=1 Tax=Bacillus sp. FJAT-49736 TaxID=2833582 RepID=UPI001BCA4B38|nr:CBS domain-containing protein [Bacillus sp. FJAT-49736]MBS4173305.1 CBS domain-containing protein [Bacillus sp. FJAT-49736]